MLAMHEVSLERGTALHAVARWCTNKTSHEGVTGMIVSLEITVRNGNAQRAADLVKQSLASAREWEGCLGIEVAFSSETDTVFVFEHWQSEGHAEKYRDWRRASSAPDVLADNGLKVEAPRRRVFDEIP